MSETRVLTAFNNGVVNESAISEAATLLKAGEVVAFPTETVYGLGANAFDQAAVARIFEAKGRPANNPLIVHVADIAQAQALCCDWTPAAQQLASVLWPGPLTLVLKKNHTVPGIVTAGGDTVAIRCPDHPVALALLRACGFPVAAPSANPSNYISPTTADHVRVGLQGRIPLILDGGPCEGGIESTVLSLVPDHPVILRPGILSVTRLSEILGHHVDIAAPQPSGGAQPLLSPGQLSVHYAPRTPLLLAEIADVSVALTSNAGKSLALLTYLPQLHEAVSTEVAVYPMPVSPADYARKLFATLHLVDENSHHLAVCEMPPDNPDWAGVRDRLTRAGTMLQPD